MMNDYLIKISILKVNEIISNTLYEYKGSYLSLQKHLDDLGYINMFNYYIKYENVYTNIITITKIKGGN